MLKDSPASFFLKEIEMALADEVCRFKKEILSITAGGERGRETYFRLPLQINDLC